MNKSRYTDYIEERKKADSKKYAYEKNIPIAASTVINSEIEGQTLNISFISTNISHLAD